MQNGRNSLELEPSPLQTGDTGISEYSFAGATFDAVVASEVIEHVSNVPEFCASLVALTKPGGSLVISTINRTSRSYAVAIIGAEQILGLLPEGTHQWDRFITPGMAS